MVSNIKDLWRLVDKRLGEIETRALQELVSASEYREMVRCQEKIKAIKTLRAMEHELRE